LAPDRLDIDDFGGGDQGLEFVCGDLDAIIGGKIEGI